MPGEWAIRAPTARTVVPAVLLRLSPSKACRFATGDLAPIPIPAPIEPVMYLVASDRDGNHAAYATPGRATIRQQPEIKSFETSGRIVRAVGA